MYIYTVFKAFKFRLYPTDSQAILIGKHIGSARFLYNLALETKQTAWKSGGVSLSCFDLINQIPELKTECEWLKEVNSQSLQQSVKNMDIAFRKFFKGAGFPKFKSKSNGRQSFSVPQSVQIENGRLVIPKFKNGIDIVLHRPINGIIKSATISVTPTGKYFASILCETEEEIKAKPNVTEKTAIGIDLGLKSFLVTSDGETIDSPKYFRKSESKLKYLQRKFSKKKGKRTKQKIALLHEKVASQRKDFLHKVSINLIKNHDSVCVENLRISNMVKNHSLAKSISDAGWGLFVTMLEYKAEWHGKNLLKIGSFEPSSKTCSCCGSIHDTLNLHDREWTCSDCGAVLNRDVNASINIKNFALKNLSVGRRLKNRKELPTLVGALTSESHFG